jgi:sec-independent protein translocase protein TatC
LRADLTPERWETEAAASEPKRPDRPSDSRPVTLAQHVAELRKRIIRVSVALAVGATAGWFLYGFVLRLLIRPYCALDVQHRLDGAGGDCALIATSVLEPFSVHLKVALLIGVVLSAPVAFHQVWTLVAPTLTSAQRRHGLMFVVCAQLMFLLGAAFAFFVMSKGLEVLVGLGGDRIFTLLSAADYVSFMIRTTLAFGLVFEMPVVLLSLVLVGVTDSARLARLRAHAIVVNLVLAAVLTPTVDPVSMLLMAGPMVALYEATVLLAKLIERSR